MSSQNEKQQLFDDYLALFRNEKETIMQKINAVDAKILRSQMEVDKLSKKNTLATSNIEKLLTIINRASKDQVIQVYQNALEIYQRFMTMHGQVGRLETEKSILESEIILLEKLRLFFDNISGDIRLSSESNASLVETIIQSQETERLSLAQQMHDGPAQQISNFILQTEIAVRYFSVDQEKAEEELEALKNTASKTFKNMRDFIFKLRPMMLDDLGIVPTMRRYVKLLDEKLSQKIRFNFSGSEKRLESYIEIMIFRAIQELLDNSIEHSNASEISIDLNLIDDLVSVKIEDNGSGFDFNDLDNESGLGIKLIRDRIRMMNGDIAIDSKIGEGTIISFTIPVEVNQKLISL